MSEIGQSIKSIVKKGIEMIGNSAESLASTTRQKVEAYNLSNEQKEVFALIGSKVFEMSKQGIVFPNELDDDLKKASEINDALHSLRNETGNACNEAEANETREGIPSLKPVDAEEKSEPLQAAEFAAANNNDTPVIIVEDDETNEDNSSGSESCPLSSAINDLFESMPKVDKMMDKVNNSLDGLGESLRKFSGDLGKQLEDFSDEMMGVEKDHNNSDNG